MVSCIWEHFSKDSSAEKGICNVCNPSAARKVRTTSNLWRHMKSVHPAALTASTTDFNQFCEKIVRLITIDNTTFRIVDRPEFHALFPPNTRMPTRYHLSKNVMPSMVEELRSTISERLTGKRVTLCVDQWTSKGGRITLSCFNAHYINEQGELRSLVVAVPPLAGRHTADNLRAQIEEVVDKYNLDIAAVMTDSASNIRKAVKDMGLFNPRCAAHQLHLAVTNAMAKWTHNSELTKIKNFARTLNKSSHIRAQYFKYCADFWPLLVSLRVWKPDGDRSTTLSRWCFSSGPRSILRSKLITRPNILELNCMTALSDECQLKLTKLAHLLKPFDEFTTKMCSESCLLTEVAFILSQITHIVQSFIEEETGPCDELAKLLLTQMEKRTPYYTESEEMKKLLFFDPRAVEVFPNDWKAIGDSVMSSAAPSTTSPKSAVPNPYSFCQKMRKLDNSTPIKEEIEEYLYECNRGTSMTMNPLQFWNSHSGSFYPNSIFLMK